MVLLAKLSIVVVVVAVVINYLMAVGHDEHASYLSLWRGKAAKG